ncbi:MAG: DctP family TRAP transporter solute-binding subunit [Thermodesulfobacteriota bacterium]|nr:DctP family TRAP transporter solute-binding subunit [Thermodesulfobacteriota bacterium]
MRIKFNKGVGYFLVLLLSVALLVAFSMPAGAAKFKKEYKLTLNVGPQFYWGMGAQKFADLVKEKTNGQINIKPYWGSALLKGAQLKSPQMVASGVIDCAYESTINSSPVMPEMNIFSLPFFINNFENLDKMEYGETGKAIFNAMDKKGLVGLAWGENGFRQVTNSKRPIHRPEDVKGLKIRVVGSPIFIDIFRKLGADPVNMNWGDAVTAFQQGVVDGQENPLPGVAIAVQIFNYHKYITRWNYLVDPVIVYWNKKQFNAFPKDIQKAIREAAVESARFEKALCRAGLDGEKSLNILKNEFNYTIKIPDPVKYTESKGMVVTNLTDEERNAFIEATKSLYEKWVPKIGKELYEKAKADMGK